MNLKTNKLIKCVSKIVSKKTNRDSLKYMNCVDGKIYASNSFYAIRMESESVENGLYSSEMLKSANEYTEIKKSESNFPDIEVFMNEVDGVAVGLNIDHLMDLLTIYKKAGSKNIVLNVSEKPKEPVSIKSFEKIHGNDIENINCILMPIKL